ncbi:hypothetical protein PO124_26425 [Bacillus licheniformis]|nr:hypothetical protein [Bacillus licheniformis]
METLLDVMKEYDVGRIVSRQARPSTAVQKTSLSRKKPNLSPFTRTAKSNG